jgi:hypothetical protein
MVRKKFMPNRILDMRNVRRGHLCGSILPSTGWPDALKAKVQRGATPLDRLVGSCQPDSIRPCCLHDAGSAGRLR